MSNIIDIQMVPQAEIEIAVIYRDQEVPAAQVMPEVEPPPSALVESLCERLKAMRKGTYLMFPVKKINNISVEVTLTKDRKSSYVFSIGPTEFSVEDSLYETIYDRQNNDATRAMSEDAFIKYIVRDTLLDLKSVTIDKLNGKFSTKLLTPDELKIDAMWSEFCQEYKDDENIVLSINECCVCFTQTKSMTNCEHAVCLECISKLRTDQVADEHNVPQKSCPLCRQRILYLK
jgi:hypothetical protein